MASNSRLSVFSLVLLLIFTVTASKAQGHAEPPPAPMQDWLALTAHQAGGIAPGTRITMGDGVRRAAVLPPNLMSDARSTTARSINRPSGSQVSLSGAVLGGPISIHSGHTPRQERPGDIHLRDSQSAPHQCHTVRGRRAAGQLESWSNATGPWCAECLWLPTAPGACIAQPLAPQRRPALGAS
jgi:hypothetical protein